MNIHEHITKHKSDDPCDYEGIYRWQGKEFIPAKQPKPTESYCRSGRADVLKARLENGEDLWHPEDVVQLRDAHIETGRTRWSE